MKTLLKNIAIAVMAMSSFHCMAADKQTLVNSIENNRGFQQVDEMGRALLTKGFNAGSGYSEVWVRDLNTFVETALDVVSPKEVRGAILVFFALQQPNGQIVDGYVLEKECDWDASLRYLSDADPNHVGFKNTVETDQETSLVQTVAKYIRKTGDASILNEVVGGKTVYERMKMAVDYLMREKYSSKYGLITGALTADWGDVQALDDELIHINKNTIVTIDCYDNAMLVIALDDLASMSTGNDRKMWQGMRKKFAKNTRKYLWDNKRKKVIPHVYIDPKPDMGDFNEDDVHYHGGTAIAIEAGLLTKKEIEIVNKQMLENVRLSGMPTIGLTVYPPYPDGFFHGGMAKPYIYQNGGDWTWFGGRMIQQLIVNGFINEAYDEVLPMIDRVIKNKGFYEWYGQGGVPSGSGHFKGSAGVLCKAIQMFRDWAKDNKE